MRVRALEPAVTAKSISLYPVAEVIAVTTAARFAGVELKSTDNEFVPSCRNNVFPLRELKSDDAKPATDWTSAVVFKTPVVV